jgi:hypothetical protein
MSYAQLNGSLIRVVFTSPPANNADLKFMWTGHPNG